MRLATLTLSVSPSQQVLFTVGSDGTDHTFEGPPISVAVQLGDALIGHEYSDAEQRARVVRRAASQFDPPGYGSWFGQWISETDEDAVLCVHTSDLRLSPLPWEEILVPSGYPVGRASVVRVCNRDGDPPPATPVQVRMLLAGWSALTGYPLPGVVRELNELSGKVDRQRLIVAPLAEPTSAQLLTACRQPGVTFVHLSPPSLLYQNGVLAIPTSPESTSPATTPSQVTSGRTIDAVPLSVLNAELKKNDALGLVMLNACNSGLLGCGEIANALNVVAIGWPALVGDDIAADFSFYFYQRLLESQSPLQAVRSFAGTIGAPQIAVDIPVIWLPSPAWVSWQPFPVLEAKPAASPKARQRTSAALPAATAPAHAPASGETSAATAIAPTLRLEFRPRASINPALLINGLPPIEHISIESSSEREVHLRIECDTGADISTFRQTVQLKMGVVPVTSTDIHFPALHELIDRHAGRRRVSFTATVSRLDGTEISEQTRTAVWMGAKEWLDQEDTWAFVPAFVNPFDEGVLEVFEHAKKVLRTLGNPNDSFDGYQRAGQPEYVSTQMKAIFQTLRDDSIGITYISPPGSPVIDAASKRACGQVVRTHSEVVKRKLGTCHDLALLVAACAEYIGIRPLIFLIPGHTFVGYWLNPGAQQKYWAQREGRLRTKKFGQSWTITDGSEVLTLLTTGDIALVETTYVCQREKTFQDACIDRAEQFKLVDQGKLDVAIDVFASRREVQPL